VKDDDLVVGTHGRSIWILDDLTVVREWADAMKDKPLHLYTARPAVKWNYGGGNVASYLRSSTAANPATGAVVWFHVAEKTKGDVTLEVRDTKGELVAKAKGKIGEKDGDKKDDDEDQGPPGKRERKIEAKVGANRYVWDLTHDGAEIIPGAVVDSGFPGQPIPAAPGTYTLKLTVGTAAAEQKVEVKPDPRLAAAEEKLAVDVPVGNDVTVIPPGDEALTVRIVPPLLDQEKLALRIRDDVTRLSQTVARIRGLQKQIALRKDLLKGNDDAKQLVKDSEALGKKLTELEEKLHNPKAKISYDVFAARGGAMLYSQLVWLLGNVTDGDGAPTKAQKDLADELGKQLSAHVSAFEKLTTADVAKLDDAAKALGVPGLYVPPAKNKDVAKSDEK
jgi:hypothetical protein